jgi:hypothetical protein
MAAVLVCDVCAQLLLLLLLLLRFYMSDAAVDRLGTVLRLLYIRDLRQLQTTIDRMLVEVQVSRKPCSG